MTQTNPIMLGEEDEGIIENRGKICLGQVNKKTQKRESSERGEEAQSAQRR